MASQSSQNAPAKGKKKQFTAKERAFEKININQELDLLESMLAELRVQYEQYFLGVREREPQKFHDDVKRQLRRLMNAPFKNSASKYKLRNLKARYHTFNTYWQRVLKEREAGTYFRDVFKMELREEQIKEDVRSQSAKGKVEKGVESLFNSYKSALEKQTGRGQNIDVQAFRNSLVNRANDFRKKHGAKKVSFSVKVQDGKVSVLLKGVN